jgi:hypothetical protein
MLTMKKGYPSAALYLIVSNGDAHRDRARVRV